MCVYIFVIYQVLLFSILMHTNSLSDHTSYLSTLIISMIALNVKNAVGIKNLCLC